MMQISPELYDEAARRVSGIRGVVGLGYGLRETGGQVTSEHAWRVYVREKLPIGVLGGNGAPETLFGLSIDVVAVSPVRPSGFLRRAFRSDRQRRSSLAPGDGLLNAKGMPGTVGAVVQSRLTNEPLILTAYHVLFARKAGAGDKVWSGTAPGGSRTIATTVMGRLGVLRHGGADVFVDAALARIDPSVTFRTGPAHTGQTTPGARVRKSGAATGRTAGIVVDTCYPDQWHWEFRSQRAPRQILIHPDPPDSAAFSTAGDSGAVVVDETGAAVGMLWGSNARGDGVASPISAVCHALGTTFERPL